MFANNTIKIFSDNQAGASLEIILFLKIISVFVFLVLQRAIRGWVYRRRYQKLKHAALVIQKHFRARGYRKRYLVMRNGYKRLQACIVSRQLTHALFRIKKNITIIQARCKG